MEDWLQTLPEGIRQAIHSTGVTILLAWVGRMAWHARLVQMGKRQFWSMHLFWELPVAIGIGFVADGVAEYFDLHGKTAFGAIVAIAYLGPRGVENIIVQLSKLKGIPK